MVTGKTIGELTELSSINHTTKIPVEASGDTYHVNYSAITPYRIYRALITQTGAITYTGGSDTPIGGFILNETYTITNYSPGDDFSNVGSVVSGNMNETNCVFIATGDTSSLTITANTWVDSVITSNGDVIIHELENTTGFELISLFNPADTGYYAFFINSSTESGLINHKTSVTVGSIPFGSLPLSTSVPMYFSGLIPDTSLPLIWVLDSLTLTPINDSLFYTPLEIKVYY
jgi:hypothetical protein